MNRPTRTPTLRIGSAAMMARDRLAPEITNVSVRTDDRRAFLGVIDAREQLIAKKIDRFVTPGKDALRFAEQAAGCAIDATIAMQGEQPDIEKTRAQLELTAALAIAGLRHLKGKG